MKLIAGVVRTFSRILGRNERDLNRSRLVGLYLNQANGRDGAAAEANQTRQRRNGKYSHNRERA